MTARPSVAILFACIVTLACAADGSGSDGADTGSQGTAGAPIDGPTPACDAYIECAAEHTPSELGQIIETYGDDGTCWQGDADLAQTCNGACLSALESFEEGLGPDACEEPAVDDSDGTNDDTPGGDGGMGGPEVDLGDASCVRFGRDTLADFLVSEGVEVTCTPTLGEGAGSLPAGLSVDAGCEFTGSITEDRVGAWAQIFAVGNADGQTFVPFCATRDTSETGYGVEFSPAALLSDSFTPGQTLELGTATEPAMVVTPPPGACDETGCNYRFMFVAAASAFDERSVALDSDLMLDEAMPGAASLQQVLSASGPAVPAEFDARPWVFSVDIDYCFAPDSSCQPPAVLEDAFISIALVMTPA